jgi:hypothetical protein
MVQIELIHQEALSGGNMSEGRKILLELNAGWINCSEEINILESDIKNLLKRTKTIPLVELDIVKMVDTNLNICPQIVPTNLRESLLWTKGLPACRSKLCLNSKLRKRISNMSII